MSDGPLVGVLGGGQLGRMLAQAGAPLGVRFRFWDPDRAACAASVGEHVCAPYEDAGALDRFCEGLDGATYEFENVPAEVVAEVESRVGMRPGARSLTMTQDRAVEKEFLRSCVARVAAFAVVDDEAGLDAAVAAVGLPAVLKTRRFGYDGKGQCVVRAGGSLDEARALAASAACVLEGFVEFERELSVVVVRGASGETAVYPLAENLHRDGILRVSVAPASQTAALDAEASRVARRVAEELGHVGALCVELFETGGGLVVNEVAPRVHNTGHWTIDGAVCSQFENHVRAVTGMALGETSAVDRCVMVNLIGEFPAEARVLEVDAGARVHLYGKSARAGRKVGHVTLVGGDLSGRVGRLAGLPGVDGETAAAAVERLRVW